MQNVELTKGKCPVCQGSISKKWAGGNPTIGTTCENCFQKRKDVFGPENVEIKVTAQLCYDPLLGVHEYRFDWSGTRVLVNGKMGTVGITYGDSAVVKFDCDEDQYGTSIKGLDYWTLKSIYERSGGKVSPDPLNFEPYVPRKAKLMKRPVLPLHVNVDDNGLVRSIKVGKNFRTLQNAIQSGRLPGVHSLHAFANMYVRYKFGLGPNYVVEGGFVGPNFEVRNSDTFNGGVGINITRNRLAHDVVSAKTASDLVQLAIRETLLGSLLGKEEARLGVVKPQSVDHVLAMWAAVMMVFLMYDWRKVPFETVEDIWKHYCTMQDVLLNIMPAEEVAAAMNYASNKRMVHYGSSF